MHVLGDRFKMQFVGLTAVLRVCKDALRVCCVFVGWCDPCCSLVCVWVGSLCAQASLVAAPASGTGVSSRVGTGVSSRVGTGVSSRVGHVPLLARPLVFGHNFFLVNVYFDAPLFKGWRGVVVVRHLGRVLCTHTSRSMGLRLRCGLHSIAYARV
jgi:hypothetical protein